MKILWLTWKDQHHPQAGGAELVNEELAKRLAADGHEVIFLVSGFANSKPEEKRDGFTVLRLGNRYSVYWKAYRYYKTHLSAWPDLVIDEVNTIPFFAKSYVGQKNLLFVHQLCREIWFYQMFFPLSLIGYLLEPFYLWFLNDREVVTVSESTKRDLVRFGFKAERIHIISEGIEIEPLKSLEGLEKYTVPTMLALGAIRPMKRTHHIVKAFEIVKKTIPNARLIVAGSAEGKYGARVLEIIKDSPYAADIEYLGSVSSEKKLELLQKSHLICVTSVKEGWGLVVTEANSQGTPAVVYDVDGLRDSVQDGKTGSITKQNTPQSLSEKIVDMLRDKPHYESMQKSGWELSKEVDFGKSSKKFTELIRYE